MKPISDKERIDEVMEKKNGKRSKKGGNSSSTRRNGNPGKGNRSKRGNKGRQDYREDGPATETETANDPQDYNFNPALVQAAASLPSGFPIGIDYALSEHKSLQIPGIMSIDVLTGPGRSNAENSAMMMATRGIYADIRSSNSGGANYMAVDLMLYMLAFDEASAMYYNGARAYSLLMSSDPFNRYVPKAIINALGFDYDDLVTNFARFNYVINNFSARLNSFIVPALRYFSQHADMFSKIFTDENSIKAQQIIFRPAGYRVLDKTSPTGGQLLWHKIDYTTEDPEYHGITVDIWANMMEEMIHALEDNEDVAIMCGDIFKRYGTRVLRITPIPQFVINTPEHSENVLLQIKNMNWMPFGFMDLTSADTNFDVYQDPSIGKGLLLYTPKVKFRSAAILSEYKALGQDPSDRQVLHFTKTAPEPLEFVEYCKFKNTLQILSETDRTAYFVAFGCNLLTDVNIYTYEDGNLIRTSVSPIYFISDGQTGASILNAMKLLERVSAFDYAPFISYANIGSGSTVSGSVRTIGEMDNFTFLTGANITAIQDTAVMSLWEVPITLSGQK